MTDRLIIADCEVVDPSTRSTARKHVVIEGGIITEVRDAKRGAPDGGPVVDARGHVTTAGLIDTHVHLALDTTEATWFEVNAPADVLALRCFRHAQQNLAKGLTTVRDLGAPGFAVVALRDAIAKHGMSGPRILACGRAITSTGGHQWNLSIEVDGPAAARRATREVIKAGADCVKIFASGFPCVEPEGYSGHHLQPDEIQAVVVEAHERKRKVAVHACNEQAVRDAVEAGADSIEHGIKLSDDVLRLMAERGVGLAATLGCVATFTGSNIDDPSSFSVYTRDTFATVRRAHELGVPILAASDSGFLPPGDLATELRALASAGLDDAVVLAAATTTAARSLALPDRGAVEVGLLGDVVVWKDSFYGEPHVVVLGGRVVAETAAGGRR